MHVISYTINYHSISPIDNLFVNNSSNSQLFLAHLCSTRVAMCNFYSKNLIRNNPPKSEGIFMAFTIDYEL